MSKYEIFKGKDGYYFRIIDSVGKVVLISEAYSNRANAQKGIDSVIRNSKTSKGFESRISKAGKHYFVVRSARNGRILGKSSSYSSKTGRDWGMKKVSRASK